MLKKLYAYAFHAPLPVLLYLIGIVALPVSEGVHYSVAMLAADMALHFGLLVAAGIILEWRIRKYPTRVLATAHATLLSFIVAALLFVICDMFLAIFIFRQKIYLTHVDDSEAMRFILTWLCLGWLAHIKVLRKDEAELRKDSELHQQALISLREAELFRLRQQLQPHFLYNSLNSINALIHLDADKAQEMVGRLSDFLRLSVKRDSSELIPLQDELAYIESYLSIESVRFGERLQISIEKLSEHLEQAQLPPLILQPILENAIKFGLYGNTGVVHILIKIALSEKLLSIEVQNPFDTGSNTPHGTGYGLEGIARRLSILYGRTDLLQLQKSGNTFITSVKIPQQHV